MKKNNGQDNQTEKLFEIKKMLNVDEASAMFGISKSMLYKHKDYGIPAYSSSGKKNGALRFKTDDLSKWWDERMIS